MMHREGSIYLVVRPSRYGELSVVKATNRKPRSTTEGSVVVKLKLRIPKAAFEPLRPEATVTVPESLVQHPVEVEAIEGEPI